MVDKIDELAREEKRRYEAEWRRRNPDKVRERNRRYWERRAKKRLIAQANRGDGEAAT